ncbi:MAG: flippase-like domain-containing protein, partial [Gammaproteobacteria bacterium]|nr:flippase-like domain-containing protein [Gammaproteobacteria bacterium]
MKKWLTTILVVAITALLLGYALWKVDLEALGEVLAGADYRFVVPFLVILTLFFWIKAWRWAVILEPLGRYSVRQVTPAMMIGFAANNVLPAHLGELVRSFWFARRYRQSASAVLVSQVLER